MFDATKIVSICNWSFATNKDGFAFQIISEDDKWLGSLELPNTRGYMLDYIGVNPELKKYYRRIFKTTDPDLIVLVKLLINV